MADLPCDGDGVCMICRSKVPEPESLLCTLCATPWHVPCLSRPPDTMASAASWLCPDCSPPPDAAPNPAPVASSGGLVAAVKAIEADGSLSEVEKARRRQKLLGGSANAAEDGAKTLENKEEDSVLDLLDKKFNCSFCMQLPERPVTTPCGHNFCLKCFQKWVGQGKSTCAKCRAPIPSKMASQPRINSALVIAIRMAKTAKVQTVKAPQVYHFMRNENRPDKAFTTERAKRTGKSNACSGQIFVTIPPDHFGPITAEYDPKRNQGVLVGESWEDRMDCRQWGVHFPHVAGIAGQSDYGAQSVALSGGYVDDEDHGEWFLYTGSGGRDLSGNKRTNKDQSFDQKFTKLNEALRVSCRKGYPVRVVRSHKEKRSSYAPETGVRYDGVYRIEKCWRKVGCQGFKVCRYLFVRCDNEPAPWTSDGIGDRPRSLPVIKELKNATEITERKERAAWDYDENSGWKWVKPPPVSKKPVMVQDPNDARKRKAVRLAQNISVKERLLREFSCLICREVMKSPLTTPCAHNFCKPCLLGKFNDLSFVKERTRENGRTLRAQKVVNKCPCCPNDISEFLKNPQVNREMMDLIESLQTEFREQNASEGSYEASDIVDGQDSDDMAGKISKGSDTYANGKVTHEGGESSEDIDNIKKVDSIPNKRACNGSKKAVGRTGPSKKLQKTEGSVLMEGDDLTAKSGKGNNIDANGMFTPEGGKGLKDVDKSKKSDSISKGRACNDSQKTPGRTRASQRLLKTEEGSVLKESDDMVAKMGKCKDTDANGKVTPEGKNLELVDKSKKVSISNRRACNGSTKIAGRTRASSRKSGKTEEDSVLMHGEDSDFQESGIIGTKIGRAKTVNANVSEETKAKEESSSSSIAKRKAAVAEKKTAGRKRGSNKMKQTDEGDDSDFEKPVLRNVKAKTAK